MLRYGWQLGATENHHTELALHTSDLASIVQQTQNASSQCRGNPKELREQRDLTMTNYQPPFSVSYEHIERVSRISEQIELLNFLTPQLRRGNRIRTIQASLAIEQNTLSVEQVTAVIEGKPVLGLPHEIQEVRNAFAAYELWAVEINNYPKYLWLCS